MNNIKKKLVYENNNSCVQLCRSKKVFIVSQTLVLLRLFKNVFCCCDVFGVAFLHACIKRMNFFVTNHLYDMNRPDSVKL